MTGKMVSVTEDQDADSPMMGMAAAGALAEVGNAVGMTIEMIEIAMIIGGMTTEVAAVVAEIAIAVEAGNGAEVEGDGVEVEGEGIQETL